MPITHTRSHNPMKTAPVPAATSKPAATVTTVAYTDPITRSEAQSWACNGADPAIFWPTTQAALDQARGLCAGCPLRSRCAARGVEGREWGVWGGHLLDRGRVTTDLFPVTKPEVIPA